MRGAIAWAALGFGVAAGPAACGLAPCTEIGCVGGLEVAVADAAGRPVPTFSGEARFEGRVVAFQCDPSLPGTAQVQCGSGSVRLLQAEGDVQLEVRAPGGGAFAGTLQPRYETSRPNGPLCEPVCRTATAQVALR
jgi:hypothetical protein